MDGQRHVPASLLPGQTRYPLKRRPGGPQGRSGWGREILPPHRDAIQGPSSPWRVAMPTTLPQPTYAIKNGKIFSILERFDENDIHEAAPD